MDEKNKVIGRNWKFLYMHKLKFKVEFEKICV